MSARNCILHSPFSLQEISFPKSFFSCHFSKKYPFGVIPTILNPRDVSPDYGNSGYLLGTSLAIALTTIFRNGFLAWDMDFLIVSFSRLFYPLSTYGVIVPLASCGLPNQLLQFILNNVCLKFYMRTPYMFMVFFHDPKYLNHQNINVTICMLNINKVQQ